MYSLLTVDLLHEVELGVWKSLFIHILRLLQLLSPTHGHNELDRRYVCDEPQGRMHDVYMPHQSRIRAVPTFGKDTIRRFTGNVSGLKHITAHDFEDLLQVCTLSPSR